jgi:signal transduction histidine kinase
VSGLRPGEGWLDARCGECSLGQVNASLVAELRAANERLRARNLQLEAQEAALRKAAAVKSEFLANMSHELRTPVNVIMGYTSLLREHIYGPLTPEQEQALARSLGSSQQLLDLINDVLDLAKIEAGGMSVTLEAVPLVPLVEEVSASVAPLLRQKGLRYHVEIDAAVPSAHCDRARLRQVLLNLLSNAVKFTPSGSVEVRIAPAPADGFVEFRVTDTGIGIGAEHLATIFEDFQQVDPSLTREQGGTGLGLAITRKLLGLMGGSIGVESQPGVGTTFTAVVPGVSLAVAEACREVA